MALLRFVCFPSSTSSIIFTNQHKQCIQPIINHYHPKPISFQSLSVSVSLTTRLTRPNFLVFQTQAAVESPLETVQQSPSSSEEQQHEEEEEEDDEGSRTRLLAQNVPWTATADDIRPLFEKYGTVVDIEELMGRTLNLTWAKPKKMKNPSSPAQPKPSPVHNLFVANLSFKARSKDLVEFFNAENGNAVSAEIIFNQNPRGSAGYGFVSFNTKQEAEAALTAFQGKKFMGRPIRVAPSKRFLRQSTKKVIESKDESSNPESDASEQAQTTDAGASSVET